MGNVPDAVPIGCASTAENQAGGVVTGNGYGGRWVSQKCGNGDGYGDGMTGLKKRRMCIQDARLEGSLRDLDGRMRMRWMDEEQGCIGSMPGPSGRGRGMVRVVWCVVGSA
ncbi:MAG: hypothetical protein D8M59_03770 [Planctomycetes bacterium]|nr:hypothetical protein [Planctomycetota bacterium]